ncbi:glycosyltransferase family 2 protein [Lentibacillus sediminis]|uniref:glycosyltransferase family 2 protein n=1 Tax=Lentibacillus sediminis TaxID=1940529 RepID=UPI000C1C25F2|nr:glycosyltransferase family 2 protein [Lentibacillus sediminis]
MLERGKVSIVVPLYKVEKYIHRCTDSIRNQTYTNLEIILVNDGSPDECGNIAEEYRKKDSRIKVCHKENGGLSDARNYGMREVTGEYTMFVDSDDWIASDMVQSFIKAMTEMEADLVQGAFYYAYDDKLFVDERFFKQNAEPVILNKMNAMKELVINEKVKNFAWGKLYKTSLIQNIPFKKGVLFEDVFWAHQVMHRVEKLVLLHQPFYYYYQRPDSIVAAYTPKNLDIMEGLKERHRFLESYFPEFLNESYKLMLKTCLIHYQLLWRNKGKNAMHCQKIKTYIRQNHSYFKNAVEQDKEWSRQLTLFSLHPSLQIAYLGIRKGLRALRVLPKPEGLHAVKVNPGKEAAVK